MINSSGLLKKKICVTVFLDELFEELDEEAEDPIKKNQEANAGMKIARRPPSEQLNMFICQNENSEESVTNNLQKTRPRKRRQQSKFGKSNNSLRKELSCCVGSHVVKEGESQKFDAKTKASKPVPEIKSPVSKLLGSSDKSVMTEENLPPKSKVDREVDCTWKPSLSTKAAQFNSPLFDAEKGRVSLESKQQQTEEKYFANIRVQKPVDRRREEVKQDKPKPTGESEMLKNLSKDDGLFIASSSEKISNVTPEEVIRVWSSCKKVWNENLESDTSETECNADGNDFVKCYSPPSDSNWTERDAKTHAGQIYSAVGSDSAFLISPRKIAGCKQETKSDILETSPQAEEIPNSTDQTKFRVLMEPNGNSRIECRSKNFAEGDIFEAAGSNRVFHFGSKQNLPLKGEAPNEEANEAIANKAKVHFMNSKTLEAISQHFAEVFTKRGNLSLDTESEMIFAENPHEVQAFEPEGTISNVEFLRRITRTVEMFGDASVNNLRDVSDELIIICEDIQKESVCTRDWKEGAKSLFEMKDLYLKDMKESTVYLIEIPFVKSVEEAVP